MKNNNPPDHNRSEGDNAPEAVEPPRVNHFVGIDWADAEHEVCSIDRHERTHRQTISQSAEAIDEWVTSEIRKAGGPIAVILEQSRGPLAYALMFREDVVLYPVNPKQFARYRESYSNAGSKADASDAALLAAMLRERMHDLKPFTPDDSNTRLLARLCETRRKLVDLRTKFTQQLTDQLKGCFPLALALPHIKKCSPLWIELLRRWPQHTQLQAVDRRTLVKVFRDFRLANTKQQQQIIDAIRAAKPLCRDPAVIEPAAIMIKTLVIQMRQLGKAVEDVEKKIDEQMNQHPDADLFRRLPGAGKALAPRLLTAFGSRRDRYQSAEDVATFSGIAPVTRQSGKSRVVLTRRACPKFLRQTFHEFADHARKWCTWSSAYYRMQRARGIKHNAAIRKLALRWIRILFVVWKTRKHYDAERYLETIQRKNPAIIPFLAK